MHTRQCSTYSVGQSLSISIILMSLGIVTDGNDTLIVNKCFYFRGGMQTIKIKVGLCNIFFQPSIAVCSRDDPNIPISLYVCTYSLICIRHTEQQVITANVVNISKNQQFYACIIILQGWLLTLPIMLLHANSKSK